MKKTDLILRVWLCVLRVAEVVSNYLVSLITWFKPVTASLGHAIYFEPLQLSNLRVLT